MKLLPERGSRETIVVQPGDQASHKTNRSRMSEVLWINRERIAQGLPVRGFRRIEHLSGGDQTAAPSAASQPTKSDQVSRHQ